MSVRAALDPRPPVVSNPRGRNPQPTPWHRDRYSRFLAPSASAAEISGSPRTADEAEWRSGWETVKSQASGLGKPVRNRRSAGLRVEDGIVTSSSGAHPACFFFAGPGRGQEVPVDHRQCSVSTATCPSAVGPWVGLGCRVRLVWVRGYTRPGEGLVALSRGRSGSPLLCFGFLPLADCFWELPASPRGLQTGGRGPMYMAVGFRWGPCPGLFLVLPHHQGSWTTVRAVGQGLVNRKGCSLAWGVRRVLQGHGSGGIVAWRLAWQGLGRESV